MTPKKPGKAPHETARSTKLAQVVSSALAGICADSRQCASMGSLRHWRKSIAGWGNGKGKAAMRVYREFGEGQNVARATFSKSVWQALAYAPDPQAALEEAHSRKEAGEAVTAKIAREIAAAQKAQQEAEERAPPSHTRARDSNRLEFSPFRRPAPRGRTRHSIQNWIG